MLGRAISHFFPSSIADRDALAAFVAREAAYLAQRSTYEFTRNALAWHGQAAFGDAAFNDAFRICRWEAFAATLSAFCALAFAHLAPAAGGRRAGLEAAIVALYAEILAGHEAPRHRDGWSEAVAGLAESLRRIMPGTVPTAAEMIRDAAALIHAKMPVQAGNDREELEVIANALRFGTIGYADRLVRRLRPPETIASLLPPRR